MGKCTSAIFPVNAWITYARIRVAGDFSYTGVNRALREFAEGFPLKIFQSSLEPFLKGGLALTLA